MGSGALLALTRWDDRPAESGFRESSGPGFRVPSRALAQCRVDVAVSVNNNNNNKKQKKTRKGCDKVLGRTAADHPQSPGAPVRNRRPHAALSLLFRRFSALPGALFVSSRRPSLSLSLSPFSSPLDGFPRLTKPSFGRGFRSGMAELRRVTCTEALRGRPASERALKVGGRSSRANTDSPDKASVLWLKNGHPSRECCRCFPVHKANTNYMRAAFPIRSCVFLAQALCSSSGFLPGFPPWSSSVNFLRTIPLPRYFKMKFTACKRHLLPHVLQRKITLKINPMLKLSLLNFLICNMFNV